MTKIVYSILLLLTTFNAFSQKVKYKKEMIFICKDSTQASCRLSEESFYEDSELVREKTYNESGDIEEIIIYDNKDGKAVRKMVFNSDSIMTGESIMIYDNRGNHLKTSNYSVNNEDKILSGENIYSHDQNNFLISNEVISYKVNFRSLVKFKNDDYGNHEEVKWIIKQGRLPNTSAESEKHKYEYDYDKRVVKDSNTGTTFGKDKFEFITETTYGTNGNKINVKNFGKDRQLNYERKYIYNSDNSIERYYEYGTDGKLNTHKRYKYVY
jgi:hypothetical protein